MPRTRSRCYINWMLPVPTVGYSFLVLPIFGNFKEKYLLGPISVLLWHSIKGHCWGLPFLQQIVGKGAVSVLCNSWTFIHINSLAVFMYSSYSKATVLLWEKEENFLQLLWWLAVASSSLLPYSSSLSSTVHMLLG